MNKTTTHITTAWLLFALAGVAASLGYVEQQALEARGVTSERINGGFVACVSQYHLEQYEIATHRQQVEIMMQDNCLPTERLAEYPFIVMNDGSVDVEHVRLFLPDDSTADLYLPREAITPERSQSE